MSLSKDEPPIQSHPKIYHISKPPQKKIMGNVQEKVASFIFSKRFLFFPQPPPPQKKKKHVQSFQKYPASNPPFPGTSVHFQRLKTNPSTPRGPMATWGAAEAVLKQASLGRSVTGIRSKKKHLGVSKNRGTPKWMVYI